MKKLRIIGRIVLIISVLVVTILAFVQIPKRQCSKVEVVAHTQNESIVLPQADVERLLSEAGIETVGARIKEVDLAAITSLLKENPYIKEINFVHFAGSRLVIDYELRTLLLHVFSADGDQYFVDNEGNLVPYTPKMKDYLTGTGQSAGCRRVLQGAVPADLPSAERGARDGLHHRQPGHPVRHNG